MEKNDTGPLVSLPRGDRWDRVRDLGKMWVMYNLFVNCSEIENIFYVNRDILGTDTNMRPLSWCTAHHFLLPNDLHVLSVLSYQSFRAQNKCYLLPLKNLHVFHTQINFSLLQTGKALICASLGTLGSVYLVDELLKIHNEGLQSGRREDLLMRASNVCLRLSAKGLKYMLTWFFKINILIFLAALHSM